MWYCGITVWYRCATSSLKSLKQFVWSWRCVTWSPEHRHAGRTDRTQKVKRGLITDALVIGRIHIVDSKRFMTVQWFIAAGLRIGARSLSPPARNHGQKPSSMASLLKPTWPALSSLVGSVILFIFWLLFNMMMNLRLFGGPLLLGRPD